MRILLRFFVHNPITSLIMAVIMTFAGLYMTGHIPVDLFPDLNVPLINIITHYPGAAPEDMERLISRPIEDAIRSIPEVRRVASTSVQGLSQVSAGFSFGTSVRDARQLVLARLAQLAGHLPVGVTPRLENIGTTLQEVAGYVVYGAGDPVDLANTIRHELVGRLMNVPGVSSVQVLGGDQRAFYVKIKPQWLLRLHLGVADVVKLLQQNNLVSVAGYLERSGREYLLRGDARLQTLDDIRSLPLCRPATRCVLLGDVATVRQGRAPRHYIVHGDARLAVAFIIRKQPGADTISVVEGVDQALRGLQDLLPARSRIKKFYDQSEILRHSRDAIVHDLLIGALLAILVLYFFLGSFGPTLIVAITIPITFLATLAILGWLGLGLNMITMAALSLAVGMIVDDAIVVTENIFRHTRQGSLPGDAAVEGTAEIAGADVSGTLTTVVTFLPLALVGGIAALFIRPFALVISVALLISLLLSLTLVPTLFGRWHKATSPPSNFGVQRWLARLDRRLGAVLLWSFVHPGRVLIPAFGMLFLAAASSFLKPATLLPPIDEGAVLVEYVMPPGTALDESNRMGNQLEQMALRNRDVSCVYRRTGSPGNSYRIEGVNKGEMMIKLKPPGQRQHTAKQVILALRKLYANVPGAVFLYHQPTQEKMDESFSGLPGLFGVTIYGSRITMLTELAGKVESLLEQQPGIVNVVNNTRIKVPQLDVRIRYRDLAKYGVKAADVLATLQAARLGIEATRIMRQKESIGVRVQLDLAVPLAVDQIRHLPVVTRDGTWTELERVATVQIRHAPATITRLNGQRQVTLRAEVKGSLADTVHKLQPKLRLLPMPGGYSVEISGQYPVLLKAGRQMIFTVLASMILIYLVMLMQFHSWWQPLVILVTVPLALVGGLLALLFTGHGLDVSVGMGALTLAGISVNNAIVLMDFANRERDAGKTITEALLSAVSVRLRPILLTTLTTIAALLPVAMAALPGSTIFQPFAITLIGGLFGTTAATLLVVPTLLHVLTPISPSCEYR